MEPRATIDPRWLSMSSIPVIIPLISAANRRAKISRLPVELLVEIFMLLKEDLTFAEWHTVNLVCREWRNIALEVPLFWNRPPTRNQSLTELMLERSGSTDLFIKIRNETLASTTKSIMRHCERILSLNIYQSPIALQETQTLLLSVRKRMTRLRRINIQGDHRSESFVVSAEFLESHSQLQTLYLYDVTYDWNIFPISTLTALGLENGTTLLSPISRRQFIDALCGMPLLERLSLSFSVLFSDTSRSMSTLLGNLNVAQLDRLHYLYIVLDNLDDFDFFLHRVHLPQLSHFVVDIDGSTGDPGGYSSIVSGLHKLVCNGQYRTAFQSLILRHDRIVIADCPEDPATSGMTTFTIYHNCLDDSDSDDSNGSDLSQFLKESTLPFLKLITENYLQRVTHAAIDVYANEDEVFRLLGTLPALTDLEFHGDLARPLTRALALKPDSPNDTKPPFANLRLLTCSEYDPGDLVPELRECIYDRTVQHHELILTFSRLQNGG